MVSSIVWTFCKLYWPFGPRTNFVFWGKFCKALRCVDIPPTEGTPAKVVMPLTGIEPVTPAMELFIVTGGVEDITAAVSVILGEILEFLLSILAILFRNDAWKPVAPEVNFSGEIVEDIVWPEVGNPGLTMAGGGEEQLLSSPLVKELNNSDILSLSTGKLPSLFAESFCKDSKSWDICASASAVSWLNWDLNTGGGGPLRPNEVEAKAAAEAWAKGWVGSFGGPRSRGVGKPIVGVLLRQYSFGKLTALVPNVEKSKCSGCKIGSWVFSKKALSSFRDRKRLPVGPMMKTSYLPADAPLFRWETFRCHPGGNRSSSNKTFRFGSGGFRDRFGETWEVVDEAIATEVTTALGAVEAAEVTDPVGNDTTAEAGWPMTAGAVGRPPTGAAVPIRFPEAVKRGVEPPVIFNPWVKPSPDKVYKMKDLSNKWDISAERLTVDSKVKISKYFLMSLKKDPWKNYRLCQNWRLSIKS